MRSNSARRRTQERRTQGQRKRKPAPLHAERDMRVTLLREAWLDKRIMLSGHAARWKHLVTCDAELRYATQEYEAGRIGVGKYIRALDVVAARVP